MHRFLGGLAFLAAGLAHASSISVSNQGFETLPAGGLTFTAGCPPGCSYSYAAAITDWTETALGSNVFGQIQPGNLPNSMYTSMPSGDVPTAAFIAGSGELSQTLGATIVAGMTYTLQVDIGIPLTVGGTSDTIELLAGNSPASLVIASGSASPTAGTWATATATYVSPLGDPNAGQALTIALVSSNGVIDVRTDYDNVRVSQDVTGSAAPEPSGAGYAVLLSAGLVIILVLKRRRRSAELLRGDVR